MRDMFFNRTAKRRIFIRPEFYIGINKLDAFSNLLEHEGVFIQHGTSIQIISVSGLPSKPCQINMIKLIRKNGNIGLVGFLIPVEGEEPINLLTVLHYVLEGLFFTFLFTYYFFSRFWFNGFTQKKINIQVFKGVSKCKIKKKKNK